MPEKKKDFIQRKILNFNMKLKYIGHYKSVESPEELYTEVRDSINFPTQISYKKKRFLLNTTLLISSSKQEENLTKTAKERGIECGVKVD
jgi:hypothetical protein